MLAPNWLTVEAYDRRMYYERQRHLNGRTPPIIRMSDWITWAMPPLESITHILTQPRDYDTAFAYNYPCINYVTSEEYETMRNEWRLQAGELYMVVN